MNKNSYFLVICLLFLISMLVFSVNSLVGQNTQLNDCFNIYYDQSVISKDSTFLASEDFIYDYYFINKNFDSIYTLVNFSRLVFCERYQCLYEDSFVEVDSVFRYEEADTFYFQNPLWYYRYIGLGNNLHDQRHPYYYFNDNGKIYLRYFDERTEKIVSNLQYSLSNKDTTLMSSLPRLKLTRRRDILPDSDKSVFTGEESVLIGDMLLNCYKFEITNSKGIKKIQLFEKNKFVLIKEIGFFLGKKYILEAKRIEP